MRLSISLPVVAIAVATVFSGRPGAFSLSGPAWPQPQTPSPSIRPTWILPGRRLKRRFVRAPMPAAAGWRVPVRLRRPQLPDHQHERPNQPGSLPERLEQFGHRHDLLVVDASTQIIDADIVFWDGDSFFAGTSGCAAGSTSKTSRRMNSDMRWAWGTRRCPGRRCIPRSRPATPGIERSTRMTSPASVRFTRRRQHQPDCGSFAEQPTRQVLGCGLRL